MNRKQSGISTTIAIIGMIVLLIVGFAAGYYSNMSAAPSGETSDSAWRTQSITLAGSTTVLPIANASAVAFMNLYTGTTVTVSGGGSGVGYSNIIDDVVDIGMASREPKQTEIDSAKSNGRALLMHAIALDAVCVVVNPSVVEGGELSLTLQEVGKIFAGEYTYWDEVASGLPHEEIFVVVREPGSGTRGTFEEFTMDPWEYEVTTAANTRSSNPEVVTAVSGTQYSIGYVGFGFLNSDMYAVSMAPDSQSETIAPSTDSIASGTYPMSRYLYLLTNEQPQSGSLTDRFIDFILSPEGQEIVEQKGFLKLPEYPT